MSVISIPNAWEPRGHQVGLWNYMEGGGKRAAAVWHRRAGKDSVAINWTAVAAMTRVGTYWHMLPEAAQGRKVIWDGIDRLGRRIIDQAFPKELRKGGAGGNSNEMKIELYNGSIWQVVGSDNYNSLIGSNPVGIVFSEWSVAKPSSWDYMRPILAENGGWALFIYTPRGRNHGHQIYSIAKANPNWFASSIRRYLKRRIPFRNFPRTQEDDLRQFGEHRSRRLAVDAGIVWKLQTANHPAVAAA